MSSTLKPIMNTPQSGIGKGVVGESTPPPDGREGLPFKVALFFDGTMNNRTNTALRLDRNDNIKDGSAKDKILDNDQKDMLSSYANYYSNVSILELLNTQREPDIREVSVYMEGIGTVNFEEKVPSKDKHGNDELDKQGNKVIPTKDADIGNDQMRGFAFGAHFTGIVDRVTQGIRKAKLAIRDAYDPDRQYVKKITINVIGFSRGAAAARHFVSRYESFRGVWPQQTILPELVVNFVGLFETVSSYHESGVLGSSIPMDIVGKLFAENVGELQLALGDVPKRVIHLTAQDEVRHNFALTTIDSSLQVGEGKAFQISLPGVHSDIGGGYVERDPDNKEMDPTKTYPKEPGRPAIRLLNRENRRMLDPAEKLHLVEEGWYTDGTNGTLNQFHPVHISHHSQYLASEHYREGVAISKGQVYQPRPYLGEEFGSRHLTNEYQYVSLFLMRGMAMNDFKPGTHEVMKFQDVTDEDSIYNVPSDLVAVRDHFKDFIVNIAADDEPANRVGFPSVEQAKRTRNKYLHRSSVLLKESWTSFLKHLSPKDLKTWAAYKRNGDNTRKVYSDMGDSATGKPVKVPDLGLEEPKVDDTPTATGVPAAEQVPTGSGLGEVNDPVEMEMGEVPAGVEGPEETGTSELNDR